MEKVRLNKYLSMQGICSRREADRLADEGKILVNGVLAEMGMKVDETDEIIVDGRKIGNTETRKIVLAMNKPKGVVCSSKEKDNIIDYMNYPERIYPVGRLDKDSTGLILLTNDGDLMNEVLKARNYHEKEYEVRVNQRVTAEFLKHMSEGVFLDELGVLTRPCKIKKIDAYTFRIILTQGLNRQIRRMCSHFGYRVQYLKRVRVMNILLGNLPEGKWREVSGEELRVLRGALKHD